MALIRIEKVENSAALFLTDEMLNLLGINFGDEVEVSVVNRRLVVQSPCEARRQRIIKKSTDDILIRRKNVYQRLAEGVS